MGLLPELIVISCYYDFLSSNEVFTQIEKKNQHESISFNTILFKANKMF